MAGWRREATRWAVASNVRTNSGSSAISGADDPDRQLPFDPGEPGREHGAVPTGTEALTEAVAPQRPAGGLVEEQ